MIVALSWLAGACGGGGPQAPALRSQPIPDARCGELGVELDGRCWPVALRTQGWDEEPRRIESDPDAVAALEPLIARGCRPEGNAVAGAGAAFAHVTCGRFHGAVPGELVRVEPSGATIRVAVPATGGSRLTFIPGARPLIAAVFNHVGTMVFDARSVDGLAGWSEMGSWFNATTWGGAASPDGAWLAVPFPYHRRIDFIRVADLTAVAALQLPVEPPRGHGPGRVVWSSDGLEVTSYPLPYE